MPSFRSLSPFCRPNRRHAVLTPTMVPFESSTATCAERASSAACKSSLAEVSLAMPMRPLRTGWLLARRNRPGETALGAPTELSAFTALPSFHVPAASEGGRLTLSGQLHLLP